MPETPLNSDQMRTLENLLRAGFRFLTLERYERYLAAEKNGFVALLDTSGGKIAIFSQVGLLMGGGIGMLMDGATEKHFVLHDQRVLATPDHLAAYQSFKSELFGLLDVR